MKINLNIIENLVVKLTIIDLKWLGLSMVQPFFIFFQGGQVPPLAHACGRPW